MRAASRRFSTGAVMALAAAVAVTPLAAETALPYSVAVEVVYADGVGTASLAEDVTRRLTADLRAQAFFREVRPSQRGPAEEADLLLRVTLRDVLEETRHEASIAERSRGQDPLVRERYVATFQADVEVSLIVMPGGQVVRFRRFRQHTARRPMSLSDDAAAAARDEAVDDLARAARKAMIKGSPKKLQRRIEEAARVETTPADLSRR